MVIVQCDYEKYEHVMEAKNGKTHATQEHGILDPSFESYMISEICKIVNSWNDHDAMSRNHDFGISYFENNYDAHTNHCTKLN